MSVDMLFKLINCRSPLSVQCQWYWCIVNHCFAEIAAVCSPTGDVKEKSIAYAHMLMEQEDESNDPTKIGTTPQKYIYFSLINS